VQQLDLPSHRLLEPSPQLGQRAAGTGPQHYVERLPVGPGQLVFGERFEHLEELAITEEKAPFILEGRHCQGQRLGSTTRVAGAPRGPWRRQRLPLGRRCGRRHVRPV
jgi:hypothetical protein